MFLQGGSVESRPQAPRLSPTPSRPKFEIDITPEITEPIVEESGVKVPQEWIYYNAEDIGISFKYPRDWEVSAVGGADNNNRYMVRNDTKRHVVKFYKGEKLIRTASIDNGDYTEGMLMINGRNIIPREYVFGERMMGRSFAMYTYEYDIEGDLYGELTRSITKESRFCFEESELVDGVWPIGFEDMCAEAGRCVVLDTCDGFDWAQVVSETATSEEDIEIGKKILETVVVRN